MLVSDFHATFNACLHMHELFTAPCVQSEDVPSLNTRKIPRALARGGAGRPCAFLSAVMEADGGGVLPDSCTVAPRCITVLSPNWDYSSQTASAFCFLWQSGERFSFSRGGIPQKKKKKKKKYGFLCDRTAATASAFRQTVTQKSAKREDYRVSVLLCQSKLPLKYHVGGSVWTSSLSSCMFSTRVFNYFYIFLGYICI